MLAVSRNRAEEPRGHPLDGSCSPCATDPTATAQPAAAVRPTGDASPTCRVLIVDDHCDTAESYAILISSWGHEVRIARSGVEALKQASAWSPDVVFLDLAMPGMDGFELAKRLRQDVGLTEATLVAISGYAAPEHRRQSEESGIGHHLVKPVDPAFLKELLATLCAEHATA